MQLNVLIINDPLNIFLVYLHVDLLDFINFYVLLHPILIHYHYHFLLQLIFMLYYILLYLYLLDVLLFILFLNVDFYKIITINTQMSLNDLFNILLMVYLYNIYIYLQLQQLINMVFISIYLLFHHIHHLFLLKNRSNNINSFFLLFNVYILYILIQLDPIYKMLLANQYYYHK